MNNYNNPRRRRRRKLTRKQRILRKIHRNLPLIALLLLVIILAFYGWIIIKIMKSLNNEPKEMLVFHTADEMNDFSMSTELYDLMQCETAKEEKAIECTQTIAVSESVFKALSAESVQLVTQSTKGFPEYADEELLLAKIIEIESGKTREDRIYVGSVIINRARTNYRDFRSVDTISEVLHQKKPVQQYATVTIEKIESCIPTSESLEVAQGLIDGSIECLDESVLFQLTYKESWVEGELEDVILEGAVQYYGRPLDFEQGCQ